VFVEEVTRNLKIAYNSNFEDNEMARSNVRGEFSPVAGTGTRRVFNDNGEFIGLIVKRPEGGYQVRRFSDGKVRNKDTLAAAFATIKRAN